mmetsp:Transcript_33105/g.69254  ORF Transcript_33105/g.69254 Transcript_33105/m.69254 type:complete len:204 (+) Transcript_33105:3142-3753(+)
MRPRNGVAGILLLKVAHCKGCSAPPPHATAAPLVIAQHAKKSNKCSSTWSNQSHTGTTTPQAITPTNRGARAARTCLDGIGQLLDGRAVHDVHAVVHDDGAQQIEHGQELRVEDGGPVRREEPGGVQQDQRLRGIGGAWRHDDQRDFLGLGLHSVSDLEGIYAVIVRGELVQQKGFSSSIWAHDRDDDNIGVDISEKVQGLGH